MTIDYISDTHLDFFIKDSTPRKVAYFYSTLFTSTPNEVLIIAGDLSHSNHLSLLFLKECAKHYQQIFCVAGNHDLYNTSKTYNYRYPGLYDRFNELKAMVAPLPTVHFLDGNSVTYNGKIFAGAMGWYDCSLFHSRAYTQPMLSHWNSYTNDSNLIPTLNNPLDLFTSERPKIISALDCKPDVMITHVSPVTAPVNFSPKYQGEAANAYYAFDSTSLSLSPLHKPAFWVHGHQHDTHKFSLDSATYLRNPLGYPNEKPVFTLQSFTL